MVNHNLKLGRSEVHLWLLVRISAIVICFYTIYLFGFILLTDTLTYEIWRSFFTTFITKFFTFITMCAILLHTWIGMWQVLTDYIKHVVLRYSLQLIIVTIFIIYLLYLSIMMWNI